MTHNLMPKSKLGMTVKVSNDFARAYWSPDSVWEVRIVSAIASLVQNTDEEFRTYRLPLNILGEGFALGRNFSSIKRAINNLIDRKVEVRGEGKNFRLYAVFALCGIEDGQLVAGFHPDLMPFFLNLKNRFTLYSPKDIMALPSVYSQRLYMFLRSWAAKPEIIMPLEELHSMLNTTPSLVKKFNNFKSRVLDKAHQDINTLTKLQFEWEAVYEERAVTAIHFFLAPELVKDARDREKEAQKKRVMDHHNKLFKAMIACWKKNPVCNASQNKEECAYCDRNPSKHTQHHLQALGVKNLPAE